MKIYFDESYPPTFEIILQGAIFLDDYQDLALRKKILEIKKHHGVTEEIKYSKIGFNRELKAAKQMMKYFFKETKSYFRVIIVPFTEANLRNVPARTKTGKEILVYSDSAIKLITSNIPKASNVDIFMDRETKMERKEFYSRLNTIKAPLNSKINSVSAVDSKNNETVIVQLCDLLLGAVYQNLFPAKGESSRARMKREIGKCFNELAGIQSYDKDYWKGIKLSLAKKSSLRVHISYWKVPNFSWIIERRKKRRVAVNKI